MLYSELIRVFNTPRIVQRDAWQSAGLCYNAALLRKMDRKGSNHVKWEMGPEEHTFSDLNLCTALGCPVHKRNRTRLLPVRSIIAMAPAPILLPFVLALALALAFSFSLFRRSRDVGSLSPHSAILRMLMEWH